MRIDEITKEQLALMLRIVNTNPLFSVATIPEDHKDYATKGAHYAEVVKDVEYLASLGFLSNITEQEGNHSGLRAVLNKATGYDYSVYVATEDGILMFQSYLDEAELEMKYRNTIN
jgi:hypothetical protein